MAKTKKPSFLSPRSLLTKREYRDYQTIRKIPERDKLQREWEERKEQPKKYSKEKQYEQSRTGKVSSKASGFLRGIQRVGRTGVTRSLYERKTTPMTRPYQQTATKKSYTGRGKPRGSFDQRYAQFGGVYGYRKYLSQQRWKERQEILQQSVTNPRQREILRQIQVREQMQQQSPEAQIFPDTHGKIPLMKTIHQEIDDYANLVQ